MNKRFLAVAVAAATGALALAGCSSNGSTGGSATTPAAGGQTSASTGQASGPGVSIGLSLSTLNNPFFVSVRDGAQKEADALGAKLTVTDAQNDATTQANQIQNFQAQQLQSVIINAVDSTAAGPIVAPLIAAKVPVIAVDRAVTGADVNSFIASDNVQGGKMAADALAKAIGEKGSVIVLEGTAGTSAANDRNKGFKEGIAAYPNIKVVASQPADFDRTKGLDVATNLLQARPDVVGIFAANDEMALGAVQALGDKAGKSVFVVGFDGTSDGQAAIKAGTMVASVAQQPGELGKSAVDAAVKLVQGQSVEKTVAVPVVVLTKDSL